MGNMYYLVPTSNVPEPDYQCIALGFRLGGTFYRKARFLASTIVCKYCSMHRLNFFKCQEFIIQYLKRVHDLYLLDKYYLEQCHIKPIRYTLHNYLNMYKFLLITEWLLLLKQFVCSIFLFNFKMNLFQINGNIQLSDPNFAHRVDIL